MIEEQLDYWKRQCAISEKTVKSLSETIDNLKANHARELQIWRDRAEAAEKRLREGI